MGEAHDPKPPTPEQRAEWFVAHDAHLQALIQQGRPATSACRCMQWPCPCACHRPPSR